MTAKSALVKISHAMFFSRTSLLVLNRSFWDLTCSGWWRYQHNTNWWNQQALWQQHIWQIWKMLFTDNWYLCMRCVSVKIKYVGANNPTSGRFSCSGISSRGLEACHQLSDWELWDDKNLELLWFTNFLEKSLRNVDLSDAVLSVDCQEKKQDGKINPSCQKFSSGPPRICSDSWGCGLYCVRVRRQPESRQWCVKWDPRREEGGGWGWRQLQVHELRSPGPLCSTLWAPLLHSHPLLQVHEGSHSPRAWTWHLNKTILCRGLRRLECFWFNFMEPILFYHRTWHHSDLNSFCTSMINCWQIYCWSSDLNPNISIQNLLWADSLLLDGYKYSKNFNWYLVQHHIPYIPKSDLSCPTAARSPTKQKTHPDQNRFCQT